MDVWEYFRSRTKAELDAMPADDFAGPHQSFPIETQADVDNAAKLIGHADNPAAVKARIMAICKRKGLKPPDAWMHESMSAEYVEREADLFQAGEYPDRNLTVTEADIARLAQTVGEVPIHVEHAGGPVKLGVVTGLRAAGDWLKGKLQLLPEANALLDRLGVNTLSVAVTRALDRVQEVSVTGSPRVAGARMFSGDASELVAFSLGEQPTIGGGRMADDATKVATAEQFSALQATVAKLSETLEASEAARKTAEEQLKATAARAAATEFAMRVKDATATVDPLCAAGILPPVCKDAAVALLLSTGTVRFADADKPTAALFGEFLAQFAAATPPRFGKVLKGNSEEDPTKSLTPEQVEFFRKHYPDVDLKEIAKNVVAFSGGN